MEAFEARVELGTSGCLEVARFETFGEAKTFARMKVLDAWDRGEVLVRSAATIEGSELHERVYSVSQERLGEEQDSAGAKPHPLEEYENSTRLQWLMDKLGNVKERQLLPVSIPPPDFELQSA